MKNSLIVVLLLFLNMSAYAQAAEGGYKKCGKRVVVPQWGFRYHNP